MRKTIAILALICVSTVLKAEPLTTIGWLEFVKIQPESFDIQAKIDTGADNSSLDVTSWEAYNHKGDTWVRFEVISNDGNSLQFKRPLERYSRIKRKKAESIKRPVVKMWLCIGDKKYLAPVNLSKRDNFKYRMLIGRSFLKDRFLVDSAKTFTLTLKCDSSN